MLYIVCNSGGLRVVATALGDYLREYRPYEWLFEGKRAGKPYSVRSAEAVFEQAVKRAGIRKEVSIHSLRYSLPHIA